MPSNASRASTSLFQDGPDYVQSLERGLAVIRAFGRHTPSLTLSAAATATGLSRAVVRRQLLTLMHLGYVVQTGREFALTPRVLELGFSYLEALTWPELARLPMQALARHLHESCSMAILDGADIVYVQRVSVRKVMTVALDIGARLPAWCTSMGRVLLAALPAPDLAARLRLIDMPAFTEHSCTDHAELLARIARVHDDGYAYVEQELERGLCSLAVPLRDHTGAIAAALNVGMAFGENARQRALRDVLPALLDTAQEIRRAAGQRLPPEPGSTRRSKDATATHS